MAGNKFNTPYVRPVMTRMFAAELSKITHKLPKVNESDPYESIQFLTPTGRKVSRVYLTGVAIEVDNKSDGFFQVRISDPTGVVYASAGTQYQKEAATVLQQLETPANIGVVGKVSIYETTEGKILTSIRADQVFAIDANAKDNWNISTAEQTIAAIETMKTNHELAQQVDAIYSKEYINVLNSMKTAMNMLLTDVPAPDVPAPDSTEANTGETTDAQNATTPNNNQPDNAKMVETVILQAGKNGIAVTDLTTACSPLNIKEDKVSAALTALKATGNIYEKSKDILVHTEAI